MGNGVPYTNMLKSLAEMEFQHQDIGLGNLSQRELSTAGSMAELDYNFPVDSGQSRGTIRDLVFHSSATCV